MKIVVTGSLGHISKPLAIALIQKGHDVTVISSNTERKEAIEALGAKATIGTMEDSHFLTQVFKDADVVYVMESMGGDNFFNHGIDLVAAINKIGESYKQAVQNSGVKRVVHLSSIGGHTDKGNGLLAMHYNVEQILNKLPDDVAIKFMRPVGFYYNLLSFIPEIKATGKITTNYKAEYKEPWVSPLDIAAVIAEEIEKPFEGRTIRYIASDELSGDDIASVLGKAIGKPDLQWIKISDEEEVNKLTSIGMSMQATKGLVEMNAARGTGVLFEDYNKHKPTLSKVKITDFAKQFADVYNQK